MDESLNFRELPRLLVDEALNRTKRIEQELRQSFEELREKKEERWNRLILERYHSGIGDKTFAGGDSLFGWTSLRPKTKSQYIGFNGWSPPFSPPLKIPITTRWSKSETSLLTRYEQPVSMALVGCLSPKPYPACTEKLLNSCVSSSLALAWGWGQSFRRYAILWVDAAKPLSFTSYSATRNPHSYLTNSKERFCFLKLGRSVINPCHSNL